MQQNKKVIVIGGGAAGYFCAINIKDIAPSLDVIIIEKTASVLNKVLISGGGRCNVTNVISDPEVLIKFYPRGEKELLGPFSRFSTADTVKWFENKGVQLKPEEDRRIFPVSDNSQTIVDLFLREAYKKDIKLFTKMNVSEIRKEEDKWCVSAGDKNFCSEYLVVASGSSLKVWELLNKLGHKIIKPVPSLFTFNVKDKRINELAGVAVKNVICSINGFKRKSDGPLLITHWGLSGPAILKLSSYAARYLSDLNYKFSLNINWAPEIKLNEIRKAIEVKRDTHDRKIIHSNNLFNIPLRLWERIIEHTGVEIEKRWTDLSNKLILSIAQEINNSGFVITGKSTFKEEFVTSGGVDLKEVNFKTMESRINKNLFFAGEVLDIDALTGGFNFQSAWTTAWLTAQEITQRII